MSCMMVHAINLIHSTTTDLITTSRRMGGRRGGDSFLSSVPIIFITVLLLTQGLCGDGRHVEASLGDLDGTEIIIGNRAMEDQIKRIGAREGWARDGTR